MQSKVTIEKKIILHFELPGWTGSSTTWETPSYNNGTERPKQLTHVKETWRIEISLENAAETLRSLRELTTAIEVELSKDALKP